MKKTVLDQIPEHIRGLAGYVPGKAMRQAQRESGVAMIKLASNENPFGPSPRAGSHPRCGATSIFILTMIPLNCARCSRTTSDIAITVFLADGSLGMLDIMARTLLVPGRIALPVRAHLSAILWSRTPPGELHPVHHAATLTT